MNFDFCCCNFPKLLISKAHKTANVFVSFKTFKIVAELWQQGLNFILEFIDNNTQILPCVGQ